MSGNIIEIRNLNFSYNGQKALANVDLDVKAGDFMAMIGPNGGGKTTLIKLMLGLYAADSGTSVYLASHPGRYPIASDMCLKTFTSTRNFRFPYCMLC